MSPINPSDLQDSWRRDLSPRLHDYPPPETPIWEGDDCVCIKINRLWCPFIEGLLDVLLQESLWTGNPSDAILSIQELIVALSGDSELMNCEPSITNITFEGGVLKFVKDGTEYTVDNSENIVTSISPIAGGFEVEQGGSFTPLTSDCADPCDPYPDKPAYDKTGDDRSCNMAYHLVDYIMEKYQDSLDKAEAVGDTIAAADAILLIFPATYLVWDAITDAINEWYESTINIARALDTVEVREDMTEWLYCRIRANNHVMSETIWDDFLDEFIIIGDSLWKYLGAFKYPAIEERAHKASYGSDGSCGGFNCGDTTCIEWDFSTGDLDWIQYAAAGRGHYNGTDAWESDTVGGTTRTDIQSPVFSTPVDLVRISVFLDIDVASSSEQYFAALDDVNAEIANTSTSVGDGSQTWYSHDLEAPGVSSLRIDYQTGDGGGATGYSKLYKIQMEINGAVPTELQGLICG